MKSLNSFLVFFLMFFATIAFSQEICNNGIDDDGDGEIDINDSDCICNMIDVILGDFEEFSCCPESFTHPDNPAGINCLSDGWISASNATPDYYNTCDYVGAGDILIDPPMPFPSGEGVVGFIGDSGWKEYVGICMPSNMIPGEEYEISFSVGFNDGVNAPNTSSLNVEIGLFGKNDCSNIPASTAQCITSSSGWYEIEDFDINSSAQDMWVEFSGTFIATEATKFIAFGHSCDFVNNQDLYHFLDDVMIEGPFGDETEEVDLTGDCANGVFVEAQNGSAVSYQWYLDGVFVPGATTNPYLIPADATGEYQVYMEFADGTCAISEIVTVTLDPEPDIDPFMDMEDCTSITLPTINGTDLTGNESYFTGPGGTGTEFFSGEMITSSIQLFAFDESNGCSDEEILNITIFDDINAGPDQTICHGDMVTLIANSNSNFNWDNGVLDGVAFTPTVTQIFTATTDDGCTDVVTVTLVTEPDIDPYLDLEDCTSVTLPTINGTDLTGNGSYFTGSGGTGMEFSSGEIITSSIQLFAFDESNGCSDEEILNITIFDDINAGSDQTICHGDMVTLIANSNSNFNWDNGVLDGVAFTPTVTQDYTATTDDGCIDVVTVMVVSALDIVISGPLVLCDGEVATLEVEPSGFNTYTWSTGESNDNIEVTSPGTYSVTATDINGCPSSASFTFDIFNLPTVEILGPTSFCDGSSAVISLSDDFPTILWSDGSTGSTIDVVDDGDFEVTVTDINGCTASDDHSIEISASLSPMISSDPQCDGTVILQVGNGYDSYEWSTGEMISEITVSNAGMYAITVSDNTGCSGNSELDVIIPILPQVDISGPSIICLMSTEILEATNGFSSYLWTTGENTNTIEVTEPGDYGLVVSDLNGCTAESIHTITLDQTDQVEIIGPLLFCSGDVVPLELNKDYDLVEWSTGSTSQSIEITNAGVYEVTVTNANGCLSTAIHNIDSVSSLSPNVILDQECNGTNHLTLDLNYDNYIWSTGDITQSITTDISGVYSVTVSDDLGCTGEMELNVNSIEIDDLSIEGPGQICWNESANLIASPGQISYNWSTGETTSSINVTTSDSYSVTITAQEECTIILSHILEKVEMPIIEIETSSNCSGVGSLEILSWSSMGLEYSIDNNMNYTSDITFEDLAIGTHELFIKTTEGCELIQEFTIESTVEPQLNLTSNPSCSNENTGELFIEVLEGEDLQFSLNDQLFFSDLFVDGLSSGNYTLTVHNSIGCSKEYDFTIGEFEPLKWDIGYQVDCDNLAEVNIQIEEGELQSILFDGQVINAGIQNNIISGEHEVELIDINGCSYHEFLIIDNYITPTLSLVISNSCVGSMNGELVVSSSDPQATFSLDGFSYTSNSIFSDLAPGEYIIYMLDAIGCPQSEGFIIEDFPGVNFSVEVTNSCFGMSDGSIEVVSDEFLDIEVVGGHMVVNSMITNLSAGNYLVRVMNSQGCSLEIEVLVGEADELEVVFIQPEIDCENPSDMINLEIISSAGDYEILWSDGSTADSILVKSGSYEVVISDDCSEVKKVFTFTATPEGGHDALYVPNIFSPVANDEKNRLFKPELANNIELITYNLSVFDRWGNKIFYTEDIMSGWDGNFKEQVTELGVYVYLINATVIRCGDIEDVKYHGDVTILK